MDERPWDGRHVRVAVNERGVMLLGRRGDERVHQRQTRARRGAQVHGGIGGLAREGQNGCERLGVKLEDPFGLLGIGNQRAKPVAKFDQRD